MGLLMGNLTKEDLEKKFRELREAWFDGKIRRYAQERVWEDLEQEQIREESNH